MKDETALIITFIIFSSSIIIFLSFRWCVLFTISYIILIMFISVKHNKGEKNVKNRANQKLMD